MARVLFVCTGNICRSPIAEVLLRHRLEQEGITDWEVASAGTWTIDGRPASHYAIQLMTEQGLDLSPHRSQAVSRRLVEQADLVLVMTHSHAEALRLEFPDQVAKIHLLSEVKGGHRYDIKDPYGGSLAEYQDCVRELTTLIYGGFERIKSAVEKSAKPE